MDTPETAAWREKREHLYAVLAQLDENTCELNRIDGASRWREQAICRLEEAIYWLAEAIRHEV